MTSRTKHALTDDRAAATERDARWQAVLAHDAAADGTFYFAVRTTGVYCRPSCGARRPRAENVEFFRDAGAARSAGYRACKRCKPDLPAPASKAGLVASLCRLLENEESTPRLRDLGASVGLSPFHVQRLFKQATGITPRAYAEAHRQHRVRTALAAGDSVTRALYASGYGSSGRFYAKATPGLGMTPKKYRAGGAGETIRFAVADCSLGAVLVAATARGVAAILLGDDSSELAQDLQRRFPHAVIERGDAAFERTVSQVVAFVEARRPSLELPLDIRGTAFQRRVWQQLCSIRSGETRSYAEIARAIGAPRSVRAVAQACAANALAVAIPCHRVVRSDGDLAGYRWGKARKQQLLARERAPST
ncbi:MAG TPA: bifunctional DNA-binding transcriptional regulator/O6-methylguanine-DNA methyltransferase Ada [Planctomycetota bacterium]